MRIYIHGAGGVSPQDMTGEAPLQAAIPASEGMRFKVAEPDYKQWIDAKMIRRMSKVVKMGVAGAYRALEAASITQPDMIITGTAYGCLDDTGVFLGKMVRQQEEMLTPTAFIQSTHNTVGGQIALMLGNHGYNNTFVHRAFSFENALLDSIMLLHEKSADQILVGGVDEITTYSHQILSRFGLYKTSYNETTGLLQSNTTGTVAGEGSAFFVLGHTPSATTKAAIVGHTTLYKPADIDTVIRFIQDFLTKHRITTADIDLLLDGRNGDHTTDSLYDTIAQHLFTSHCIAAFKQLCGEYPTATAFALWLANKIISDGQLPAAAIYSGTAKQAIKNILIYNCHSGTHHTLILLTAC
ncbi:beta-ketoacyl synthase chain length factor [Chitinophaga pendula]|uniref:beta-ketoacyl synthase N-terminal-like domain-containing protein n=1 Tax=Chitinophaga TaxID=79328 RepID=UPI000BB041C4|nr:MULTISPECIES: beta-ketoacyl synthase N-terminal-like domain-containing protein [Chitinophaga]ASZ11466.1 beta-ketoacyl synthase [Chitinophaga sp. MD30]UCJ05523.1 beta-ketoacyl synthase chain length factor [Chitinophaga pendula]